MQTIISLVSAGLGVAIVPACMRNPQRTGVIYRDLTPPPPLIETMLAWHRHNRAALPARFIAHATLIQSPAGKKSNASSA
jgi:DNA-binding transcriptional LysR family regulator